MRRARTGREGTRPRPRTLPRTLMVRCPRLRLLATAVPQVPLPHRLAYNGAGRALSCVVLLPPFLGSSTPPKVPRRSQPDERMSDSRCRCAPYLATFGLILACLRRLATIRCNYRWMSSPEQLEPKVRWGRLDTRSIEANPKNYPRGGARIAQPLTRPSATTSARTTRCCSSADLRVLPIARVRGLDGAAQQASRSQRPNQDTNVNI